jgi:DNA-directed RNA polymerase subunit H (RpoH/RPB5)
LEYDGEKARKQSNKSDEYLEKMKVLKQNKLKKMIKKYKISINSLSGIYVNS